MNGPNTRVVVTDLRIPFVRLMLFFIKALFALIPALIIVGVVLMVASAVIRALLLDGNFDVLMKRWAP